MATTSVEYRDAAGQRYVGFLATPGRVAGAAVLVAHNAPGVSDFERQVAQRLAAAGYVALCADYIGNGEVLAMPAIGPRFAPLLADPSPIRAPMQAALATLTAQAGVDARRVAAIGYCFGGSAALELARTGADLKAVVGFHSGLPPGRAEDNRRIRARVLMLQGAADPIVPPDARNAFETQMNEAGVDWTMVLYGGTQHAYTVPGSENSGMPGVGYLQRADERSWRAMLDLLAATIGQP